MPVNEENDLNRSSWLTHTTNIEWLGTNLDSAPENTDCFRIFQLLFQHAKGFIKIGQYQNHDFYPTEALQDPNKVAAIIGSRKYKRNNAVVSLGVYGNTVDGSQKNVIAICGIAIDVDYHGSKDEPIYSLSSNKAAELFYGLFVEGEVIPPPTYMEYSNNFRLVYVFDKPFVIPKAPKIKRKACFNLIRRLTQVLSERIINAGLGHWNVDTKYKTHPYIRVPESINVKWDKDDFRPTSRSSIHHFNDTDHICPKSVDEVKVITDNWRTWDITVLAETVLPDKPDWYDRYKQKQQSGTKKAKPKKEYTYRDTQSVLKQRMDDLAALQRLGWNVGHREFMVYIFRLSAVQSGMTEDESIEAAIRFNEGFETPLPVHSVITSCKPSDYSRKFRNRTLRDRLGLGAKDYPELLKGDGHTRAERYQRDKAKRIANGILVPKSQQLEQTYSKIIAMQQQGSKRKEIEAALNISHTTMTRYLNAIKKRQSITDLCSTT